MLTSNVNNYASIEFITQAKPHKVVLHDMVMLPAVFDQMSELYDLTLTSKKLQIIIIQLGTPEYPNLETNPRKPSRIQPYLYCQWPYCIYANKRRLTHPQKVRPI